MIVLVHGNHDEWPNVTSVEHFSSGFDDANLAVVPKIYQNYIQQCVLFANMGTLNDRLKR